MLKLEAKNIRNRSREHLKSKPLSKRRGRFSNDAAAFRTTRSLFKQKPRSSNWKPRFANERYRLKSGRPMRGDSARRRRRKKTRRDDAKRTCRKKIRRDDTKRRHEETIRREDAGRRHGDATQRGAQREYTERRHKEKTQKDDTGRRHKEETRRERRHWETTQRADIQNSSIKQSKHSTVWASTESRLHVFRIPTFRKLHHSQSEAVQSFKNETFNDLRFQSSKTQTFKDQQNKRSNVQNPEKFRIGSMKQRNATHKQINLAKSNLETNNPSVSIIPKFTIQNLKRPRSVWNAKQSEISKFSSSKTQKLERSNVQNSESFWIETWTKKRTQRINKWIL